MLKYNWNVKIIYMRSASLLVIKIWPLVQKRLKTTAEDEEAENEVVSPWDESDILLFQVSIRSVVRALLLVCACACVRVRVRVCVCVCMKNNL
jgi:hypothetical protein